MEKRILVIDDDPDVVEVVESWLKTSGYEVYTAYSGKEGLQKCKLLRPDAVILDIIMPEMDGSSVAEEIKDDPGTSDIPIIFLTGAVKSSEVPKSHIVGGQYFIAKPFNGEDLLTMLRQILMGY